jgi:hypothetical protein
MAQMVDELKKSRRRIRSGIWYFVASGEQGCKRVIIICSRSRCRAVGVPVGRALEGAVRGSAGGYTGGAVGGSAKGVVGGSAEAAVEQLEE